MNKRRWLLHMFERAQEPTPHTEARLQHAILERVPDGRASRALLQGLDQPSSLQEQRLVAHLGAIPDRQPRRRVLPTYVAPLAMAGAAALGLTLVVANGLSDQPETLATKLEVQAEPADLAPFPGVHLAYHGGYGELGGTTLSPSIQWITGKLDVEVEPDRGIQLAVHTEEATVRVIGTRFTVERENAQTTVGVERGKVEVTCSDGERVQLTAGQQHRCASQSPNMLALRAKRLRDQGADPVEVLEVIHRGLDRAKQGNATWANLSVLHMLSVVDHGQPDQALEEAQHYLAAGHANRRDEVLRLALELSTEPCTVALDHRALLSAAGASPAQLVSLSDCLQLSEPDQARTLLERALGANGLANEERAAVQSRLDLLR